MHACVRRGRKCHLTRVGHFLSPVARDVYLHGGQVRIRRDRQGDAARGARGDAGAAARGGRRGDAGRPRCGAAGGLPGVRPPAHGPEGSRRRRWAREVRLLGAEGAPSHASAPRPAAKAFPARSRGVSTRRLGNYPPRFRWAHGARGPGDGSALLRSRMGAGTYRTSWRGLWAAPYPFHPEIAVSEAG